MTIPGRQPRGLSRHRRGVGRSQIVAGAAAVIASQGVTSATGYVFWLIAARRYPAHQVGQAASITSLSIAIALVASQAVVASLLVRLPRSEAGRPLLWSGAVMSGGGAAALGTVSVLLLPVLIPDLRILHSPLIAVAMIVMCVSQCLGLVADGAALALARFRLVAGRNAVFGAGKVAVAVALMAMVAHNGPAVLLCAWAGVGSATGIFALWRLHRLTEGSGWAFRTVAGGFGYQMVTAIGGSAPAQLLPTIVAAQAGAMMSGYFSLTWLVGGLCFTISPAVSRAMLPTSRENLSQSTRQALKIIAALLVVPIGLFLGFGREILAVFGEKYGVYGAGLLALLAISAIPDAITNVAVARWRIQERLRPAAMLNALIAVVALGLVLSVLKASTGNIALIGAAWIAAQTAGCGFVAVRSAVLRLTGARRRVLVPVQGPGVIAAHRVVGSGDAASR